MDILADDECVELSSHFHLLVYLQEFCLASVEVLAVVLGRRQVVLDRPSFRTTMVNQNGLHDLLQVDLSDVVDEPLDFESGEVGP